MRVCAGETMTIGGEFAVENGSMTLALNLDEKQKITPGEQKSVSWETNFLTVVFISDPAGPQSGLKGKEIILCFLYLPPLSRKNRKYTLVTRQSDSSNSTQIQQTEG